MQHFQLGQRVLGAEHPLTLLAVDKLARLRAGSGRYTEAEVLFRRAVDGAERVLGKDNPTTIRFSNNLANLLSKPGRVEGGP